MAGLREGSGRNMFRYYQDVIRLWRLFPALRSTNIEILHVHDDNRVLAFRRWWGNDEFLVAASLDNTPFGKGYWIGHPSLKDTTWTEVLNSDADLFGWDRHVQSGGRPFLGTRDFPFACPPMDCWSCIGCVEAKKEVIDSRRLLLRESI